MQQKINFRQKRDIGNIVNDTFLFLRENIKPLLRAIFFISGPFILLGGIAFGLYFLFIIKTPTIESTPDILIRRMSIQFILMYLLLIAGSMVFFVTIYTYIHIYINDGDVSLGEIWKGVKKRLFLAFKVFLGSVFLIALTFSIISGLFFLVALLGGLMGFFIGGGIMAVILGFLSSLLTMAPFFYVAVTLSILMSVCVFEQKGFWSGVGRAFSLISGRWWRTFGIVLAMSFICIGISMVFSLPMYVTLGIGKAFSNDGAEQAPAVFQIVTTVFSVLFMVGSYVVSSILLIGINFHYFSLVEEKDASGLLERIDSFGTVSAESRNAEEY
ncbi:hypothetical protein Solca_4232 [Sporocytophaga myxococcoides]|uniref:Glycerophosphoryl diester phosphodiesterase membrane domain-containing protein n=1 Tax=Sporocytophaga myxococcoides TaxID=153721 RepID=A0A098LJW0_9BACT|nr:hypothetical protein [Sporocytophaga myxococcoides]GAL87236.1 hypothetical protein Solca_4232 [Sporocytophaga myxococcoides]